MKNSKAAIIILLILIYQSASALIINVPGNYSTITLALRSANNGDTILVEPGTYFENLNFRGKKVVLTSRFYMNNDLSYINTTIINGSTPSQPDSASVVIFCNGEDSTAVIQGFTITGGAGTKWLDEHGAGVYREGGGILVAFCSPVIRFNKITGNTVLNNTGVTSTGGGGMRIGDGNPRIYNNIVMNNKAKYGPGIVLNYSGCSMKNNIICFNTEGAQYFSGGGIWANSDKSGLVKIIENNTIMNNSGSVGTGGVLAWSSTLYMKNNIIWGNTPTQLQATGGGILNITYSDIQNGYSGTGNISLYPLFADTNYILSTGSPCMDAGDTSSVFRDPQDSAHLGFAKYPSRGTLRCDIGAYGGPGARLLSGSLVIGVRNEVTETPSGYELGNCYPNPFNPSTTIKFSVPVKAFVSLKIYDTAGRFVASVYNNYVEAGAYEVKWDASLLSSGQYFVRMESGSFVKTTGVTLIK
ncbi:MAG: T9SS type A sorting domain-containing protein [Bacteroidetes bacterium]|nr:T9SS type A sorting domain-containing protein [Bacteroidota bacterium]